MDRIRILMVMPPVGPLGSGEAGGVETFLMNLAPILAGRGHRVGIVAPEGSLVPPGAAVYQVEGNASPSATRADRAARYHALTGGVLENMWEQALGLEREYDAITGVSYDWLPYYLTPFFRTPVGHWITIGSAIDEVDRIIEKRWRSGGLKLALHTSAQCRTFSFLRDEPLTGGRIHLLYGGVDTRVFEYRAEPENRLCWAARISPEKGLEDAVAVARALRMPLDVCGKIQDEGYWNAVMGGVHGAEIVYHGFLGPAQLRQRYGGARAMLMTPKWTEAFGNTAIESLACGTPVVAYDQGGPAEIVEHGTSGMLAAQGDIAGLIAGVKAAFQLDRKAARARAEQFSFERMADRFEAWMASIAPKG